MKLKILVFLILLGKTACGTQDYRENMKKIGDMNKQVDQLIENVTGAENNNLIEVNNPNQGAGGNPDEPSVVGALIGMKEVSKFNISEDEKNEFARELSEFIDNNQEKQEGQAQKWKNIFLYKTIFIAAQAKDREIFFKNGKNLTDDLCMWIADRLNFEKYKALSEYQYFKKIKDNVENAIANILIRKTLDYKLNISDETIREHCKQEKFLLYMFITLAKDSPTNSSIGAMDREKYFDVMKAAVFSDHPLHIKKSDTNSSNELSQTEELSQSDVLNEQKNIREQEGNNSESEGEEYFDALEKKYREKNDSSSEDDDTGEGESSEEGEEGEGSSDDSDSGKNDSDSDTIKNSGTVSPKNLSAGGDPEEPSGIWGNVTGWLKRGKNWLWTILGVGTTTVATYYILKKYKEKKH